MSAAEPAHYLSIATPDYDYTLSLAVQGKISEEGFKNQVVHMADDNSEERITLSTGSIFYVSWSWAQLSESDSGIILDLYHDPSKANGIARSFKWSGPGSNTYVARFDMKLSRIGNDSSRWGLPNIKLRLLGIVA